MTRPSLVPPLAFPLLLLAACSSVTAIIAACGHTHEKGQGQTKGCKMAFTDRHGIGPTREKKGKARNPCTVWRYTEGRSGV